MAPASSGDHYGPVAVALDEQRLLPTNGERLSKGGGREWRAVHDVPLL